MKLYIQHIQCFGCTVTRKWNSQIYSLWIILKVSKLGDIKTHQQGNFEAKRNARLGITTSARKSKL